MLINNDTLFFKIFGLFFLIITLAMTMTVSFAATDNSTEFDQDILNDNFITSSVNSIENSEKNTPLSISNVANDNVNGCTNCSDDDIDDDLSNNEVTVNDANGRYPSGNVVSSTIVSDLISSNSNSNFGPGFIVFAAPSDKNNIYISPGGDDNDGDGTLPNPYKTIAYGLTQVNDGGTIYLMDGTYADVNNTDLTIEKNVSFIGINGSTKVIIDGEDLRRIFNITGNYNVSFTGITFTRGKATGDHGGAVYTNGGTIVNIFDCNFTDNTADQGGAIRIDGNMYINGCNFTANNASTHGGAIYIIGNLNVSNSTFNNNKANGGHGGAIVNAQGNLYVDKSNFTNNTANKWGGAISANYGNNIIVNSNFKNNEGNEGGSIFVTSSAIANITGTNLTGNNATMGGAIYSDGTLNVNSSQFMGNSAIGGDNNGGAIYLNGPSHTINYCRFINNTGKDSNNQVYLNNSASNTNIDYNWWGTNAGQIQTNVNINNWFVMILNTSAASYKLNEILKFNYYFVLNDTSGNLVYDSNVNNLPYFNVTLTYNNLSFYVDDARVNNNNLSVKINSTNNNISAYDSVFFITDLTFPLHTVSIAINNTTGKYSNNVTLVANITTNGDITDLLGKTVLFFIDGINVINGTIGSDGMVRVVYFNDPSTWLSSGEYNWSAGFEGYGNYSEFYTNNMTLFIEKLNTTLVVSNVSGTYGKGTVLKASLKSEDFKGTDLSGKIIEFWINGVNVANRTTDENGNAYYTYTGSAGSYTWNGIFAGDNNYIGVNSSNSVLVISKMGTKITPSSSKFNGVYGKYVLLKSVLKDKDGKILPGKNVDIYVGGKKVKTVRSSSAGVASYNYKVTKTGSFSVVFKFNGDTNYTSSSAKSSLFVNKYSKITVTNTVKPMIGKISLTSVVKNHGPDRLTAKVTYKLEKGISVRSLSVKYGKAKYNKKTRTITLTITNLAKNKFVKLFVILSSKKKSNAYIYPKITSKNTLKVKEVNKVIR